MNSEFRFRRRGHARLKIILGLVEALVVHVVDGEIKIHAVANPLGRAQIENIQTGGFGNRGVCAIQYVIADVTIAKGPVESVPTRQREAGVCDRVRSAVHVDPGSSQKKSVDDLRKSAIESQVAGDLHRGLGFPSVGPARPFELESAVVGYIDLLI